MPSHTHSTMTHPQTPIQTPALRVKTHIKAGVIDLNHNETLVQASRPTSANHNATQAQAAGLRVKTRVQAGGFPVSTNHNETQVRAHAASRR